MSRYFFPAIFIVLCTCLPGISQNIDVLTTIPGLAAVRGSNMDYSNIGSIGISGQGSIGVSGTSTVFKELSGVQGFAYGESGYGVYGIASAATGFAGYFIYQFGVYINPRVGVNNTFPTHPVHVGTNSTNGNGAHLTSGGVWTNASSRTFKDDLEPVNAQEILEKISQLKIYYWRYIGSDDGIHLGPMAEDFSQIFSLGNDPSYIATVDADGVVGASIQALNELLDDQDKIIKNYLARIAVLEDIANAKKGE